MPPGLGSYFVSQTTSAETEVDGVTSTELVPVHGYVPSPKDGEKPVTR